MPEGHTLHRLAILHSRRYVGRPVAVRSPQGRFATSAELVDGRVLESAEAHGKHLFHHYGPDLVVHVHLGLYGKFSEPPAARRGAARPGADAHDRRDPLRGPARPDRLRAALRRRGRRHPRPPRRRPAARRRRPGPRLGPDLPLPSTAGHAADGSVGDRGRRQRLPSRGAVPARPRPATAGPRAHPEVLGRAVGRHRRPAARRRAAREDRDAAARARPPPARHGRRPVRPHGVRLQAHRRALPGLRHAGRARPSPGPQPVLVPGVPGAGDR